MRFKYFAFISYNSKDLEWGKRLQRKLEHYRLPSTLCSEYGLERQPIKPVFFAPTDIQPGGLTEEIKERLKASRHLIVICSPNSAQSEWVGREIAFFCEMGRLGHVHFFIVDGVPHSKNVETECFNPVIEQLGLPEILGANINERNYRISWLNIERAYIQLISKLLGLEFDSLWQRHKRFMRQKIAALGIGILLLASLWYFTVQSILPFTGEVFVKEVSVINTDLPTYDGGVITVYMGEEMLSDTISYESSKGIFTRIPKRYNKEEVRVSFQHPDYLTTDTLMNLKEVCELEIRRNPDVYGKVRFRLWSLSAEEPVSDCRVMISNRSEPQSASFFMDSTVSDSDGFVEFRVPISGQRSSYEVAADVPVENNVVVMPCGTDDVVLTE